MGIKEFAKKSGTYIKKLEEDYERNQATAKARELRNLRQQRIQLEGKARLERLRQQELNRIARAQRTLNPSSRVATRRRKKRSRSSGGLLDFDMDFGF